MSKPPFLLDLTASILSIAALGLFVKWAFFTHKLKDFQFYASAALIFVVIGILVSGKLKEKGSSTRFLQVGLLIQGAVIALIFALFCFYTIFKK